MPIQPPPSGTSFTPEGRTPPPTTERTWGQTIVSGAKTTGLLLAGVASATIYGLGKGLEFAGSVANSALPENYQWDIGKEEPIPVAKQALEDATGTGKLIEQPETKEATSSASPDEVEALQAQLAELRKQLAAATGEEEGVTKFREPFQYTAEHMAGLVVDNILRDIEATPSAEALGTKERGVLKQLMQNVGLGQMARDGRFTPVPGSANEEAIKGLVHRQLDALLRSEDFIIDPYDEEKALEPDEHFIDDYANQEKPKAAYGLPRVPDVLQHVTPLLLARVADAAKRLDALEMGEKAINGTINDLVGKRPLATTLEKAKGIEQAATSAKARKASWTPTLVSKTGGAPGEPPAPPAPPPAPPPPPPIRSS